jgi:hypothetical protein
MGRTSSRRPFTFMDIIRPYAGIYVILTKCQPVFLTGKWCTSDRSNGWLVQADRRPASGCPDCARAATILLLFAQRQ